MKLVIDMLEDDFEKIKNTSFVENTETMFKQSTEDRNGTMMLFRVMDSIKNGEPQKRGKWIPTTERLPDNNQTEYLVTYKRKGKLWINIGFCDDGDWYLYSNDEGPNWEPYVIAWMPLPEPYKREDDEE
jgi:hypothetical protein